MSDPLGDIASLLSSLRTLPPWILIGLALVGCAVLYAPAFGGINPEPFRQQWGIFAWIWAMGFSILSLARIVDASIATYRAHRRAVEARRVLCFIPLHQQCWWALAKQQDDSFVSQIRIDVQASNTSDRPVRIVKLGLLRPRRKHQLLNACVLLPKEGSPYHSYEHPVPPYGTVTAAMHVMVRGELGAQGKPIRIALGITDQFGEEYSLRNLSVETHDKLCSKRPRSRKVRLLKSLVSKLLTRRRHDIAPQGPAMPWTCDPGPEYIGVCESVLNEEKRSYAGRGRAGGGLGSLNVGLQSEPNLGWTTVGQIPVLLWEKGKGTPVSSINLERLLRNHDPLASSSLFSMPCFTTKLTGKHLRSSPQPLLLFPSWARFLNTVAARTL